jgi:hypothetical protein
MGRSVLRRLGVAGCCLAAAGVPAAAASAAVFVRIPPTTTTSTGTTSTTTTSTTSTTSSGGGSVTLTLTSPVSRTRTAHVAVGCTVNAHHLYRARVAASQNGYEVAANVVAPNYTGPGTYPAAGEIAVYNSATGAFLAAGRRPTATIGDDGGSTAFHFTLPRGRVVAGTISWTCGS